MYLYCWLPSDFMHQVRRMRNTKVLCEFSHGCSYGVFFMYCFLWVADGKAIIHLFWQLLKPCEAGLGSLFPKCKYPGVQWRSLFFWLGSDSGK